MGTTNSIQKVFTQQKISHFFTPPCMHEKIHKNWIVHQKNIAYAKKIDNFTIFSPRFLQISNCKIRIEDEDDLIYDTSLVIKHELYTHSSKVRGYISGGSRDLKMGNRNKVRQITKFGIVVFYKILINICI